MFNKILKNVAMRELKNKSNWIALGEMLLKELDEMCDEPKEVMEIATWLNDMVNVPLIEEEEEQIILTTIIINLNKLFKIARRKLNEDN